MVIVNSFAEYQAFEGKEIGVSEWHTIDQDQINKFADATLDHQWIHCDEEKAKMKDHSNQPLPMVI
ncbi:MaoC/PaaZ C-terminal domain-containing protein [Chitinophaga pinensis]|uniref:MaoC/PaaZ C-terminal domain-containing protein n=1 Tax=Chitinophaga pinensis TaxID=79329 RepID=UPI0021BD10E7|nr:MaoC/PaaZ C-terminal domain-containing protein [Chitinophaga pinensis]